MLDSKAIYTNYHLTFFSEAKSTQLLCTLCSTVDEHVEATHFCKTCEDPDLLCGTCAKHHQNQTLSKNHEMCADIKQFPNKERKEWYLAIIFNTKHLLSKLDPIQFLKLY